MIRGMRIRGCFGIERSELLWELVAISTFGSEEILSNLPDVETGCWLLLCTQEVTYQEVSWHSDTRRPQCGMKQGFEIEEGCNGYLWVRWSDTSITQSSNSSNNSYRLGIVFMPYTDLPIT